MSHVHREGGPTCDLSTKKACEDRYADWQAMQQVLLAYSVVMRSVPAHKSYYRKGKDQFSQLVRYIAGDIDVMTNADGNPSVAPWTQRLLRAIARVREADLPGYTLYTIPTPPGDG